MLRLARCFAVLFLAVLASTRFPAPSAGESRSPDPPPRPPESLKIALDQDGAPTPSTSNREPERTAIDGGSDRMPNGLEAAGTASPTRDLPTHDVAPHGSVSSTLLLRTGGILRGQIERNADVFTVLTRRGEIQIRARDVEFVCRDLNEAYANKRAAMFGGAADEHIRLAEWCLRHSLTQHAARELLDARRIDPRHPRIEVIERWLTWTTQTRDAVSPAIEANRAAVIPATHTEPSVAEPLGRPADGRAVRVTDEVLETFTRSIQPLILNSCTNGGCHQTGGREAFQLDRLALRHAAGRRTTLQNLEATIAWIDVDRPDASRLLVEAQRAHGTQTMPPLSGRRAELYAKLANWVREVGDQRRPKTTVSVSPDRAAPVSAVATPPVGRQDRNAVEPEPIVETVSEELPESEVTENEILRGAPLRKWQPKDAFDPDQFNRQVHP